jgi:hypothetical protein
MSKMKLARSDSPWKWTCAVMATYAALSFLLAFFPLNHFPTIIDFGSVPLIRKLMACSAYPARTQFYWHWMILGAPLMLALFGLATPIRLKRGTTREGAILACLAVLILFGLVLFPLLVWGIFWDGSDWTNSKLDRALRHSCTSQYSMGECGFMVMTAMCCGAWIGFIATLRVIFAACWARVWPNAGTLE